MSKLSTSSLKKAMLDDVYRDNSGDNSTNAAIRKRRAQHEQARRRARLLGRTAVLLVFLPMCVLAIRWILPAHAVVSAPFPNESISGLVLQGDVAGADTSFLQPIGLIRPALAERPLPQHLAGKKLNTPSVPYSWRPGDASLRTKLVMDAATSIHSPATTAKPETPSPPDKAWFQGYKRLLGRSGFNMAQLFDLDVKTIVIDAGHGGYDPGAIGPDGLKEKKVTLAVAKKLKRRLDKLQGYRVFLSRGRDHYISLKNRVRFANKHSADLFISIHVNSLPQPDRSVVETFYFGPSDDRATLRLAKMENQGSDYSIGDFHQMINLIGNTFKIRQSRALAALIQNDLYHNLHSISPHLVDDGIKTAPFVVLLGTKMPSVLVEISCISNPVEEQRLATGSYRNAIARYIEKGIVAYLNQQQPVLQTVKGAQQYAGKKAIHTG